MGVVKLRQALLVLLILLPGHEHHGHATVGDAARDHARVGGQDVPALGHGNHGKLQALGGVDRHHANRREPAARKGCRRNLGRGKPHVVLSGGASRPKPQLGREVADVADGGKDVGLTSATIATPALEALEPSGVAHHLETDVCHGPPPHELGERAPRLKLGEGGRDLRAHGHSPLA